MKTRRSLGAIAVAFVLGAGPWHSAGQVIIEHFGANDPASEGFSASIDPSAEVGPVLGDLGRDAWYTKGATVFYTKNLSVEDQSQLAGADWAVSATLRIVQTPEPSANSFVRLATGSEIYLLGFGSESDGDPFVHTYDSDIAYVLEGGGSGYHNYELRYNAQSGIADLWVDGIKRLNDVASLPSQQTLFYWGEGQGSILAWANWHSVSLSIVPEPSSFVLLFGGGLLLAVHFRRCKTAPYSGHVTDRDNSTTG